VGPSHDEALPDEMHRFLGSVLSVELLAALCSVVMTPGEPEWPRDSTRQLMARHSLPRWLAELWLTELDIETAEALAAACNVPGPIYLRINPLRAVTGRVPVATMLAEEGMTVCLPPEGQDFSDGLLVVKAPAKPNIRGSIAWQQGLFEVQDAGSQLIATATGASAGDVCLDFCAGRGGKSLALLGLVAGRGYNAGHVIAHDIDAKTLAALEPRAKRAGAVLCGILRPVGDGSVPGPMSSTNESRGYMHLCVTHGVGLGGRGGAVSESVGSTVTPRLQDLCTGIQAALQAARATKKGAPLGMGAAGYGNTASILGKRSHDGTTPHHSGLHEEEEKGEQKKAAEEWQADMVGADSVLVDAPCSSLGTLRRGPNVRWELGPKSVEGFAELQLNILRSASMFVRQGGVLVYATCTIHRAENEALVARFSEEFKGRFVVSPLCEGWGATVAQQVFRGEGSNWQEAHQVQLLPHLHGTDGFFIARWQRVRSEDRSTFCQHFDEFTKKTPDK